MQELKMSLYIIQFATTSRSSNMQCRNPDTKQLLNIERAADDMNFIIDRRVQSANFVNTFYR